MDRGRSIVSLALIICLLGALGCGVASAAEPRRVLLLHSFGQDFRPWSEYAKTIRAELERQSPWPLDFVEYSLTTARFSDEDLETPFVAYLRSAFAKHPIDLIVSIGAPAANFVQRNRPQLFSNTPMLLTAVEQRRVRFASLTEDDAVVAVSHDLPAVIANILQVLPATKTIAVVNGNSPLEKFWFEKMKNEFKPFEGRVDFIWYNTLSFDGILKSASSLPPHSAIFWELLIVDAAGAVYQGDLALTKVHNVANAPIFSFDDSFFGRELVGGPMFSVLEVSRQTAAVAVRILGGEKPRDIKTPAIGFAAPKFDWREMQRWGVSEASLPAGSKILFRDPTPWELYRYQILLVLGGLLAQAGLIAWLIYERRRGARAEAQSHYAMTELTYMDRRASAGELSAAIAHEVNQPLTGISARASAALRWMRADKPDFEKVEASLREIVATSHRAADVIVGVRTMFKKDSAQRTPIDVNGLIGTVLAILRIELERYKVDVQTHFDEQLPTVQGDKVQLQQVVLNLVMNAIDAMRSVHWRELTVRTQTTAGKIVVSVEDTGTGIDGPELDQLFKPLFTTKSNGMGMGLAICQSIIENHDGRIWVSLGAARGSIFQFELPSNPDKANTAARRLGSFSTGSA
jgi:signal transduction histidine kinase